MLFLYNIGIRLYYLFILFASLFNKKARLWIRGRKKFFKKVRSVMDPDSRIIWFHCSSLGEFEQGRPVMEKIREILPDRKILLTFYSPSGYEIRKNYMNLPTFCEGLLSMPIIIYLWVLSKEK